MYKYGNLYEYDITNEVKKIEKETEKMFKKIIKEKKKALACFLYTYLDSNTLDSDSMAKLDAGDLENMEIIVEYFAQLNHNQQHWYMGLLANKGGRIAYKYANDSAFKSVVDRIKSIIDSIELQERKLDIKEKIKAFTDKCHVFPEGYFVYMINYASTNFPEIKIIDFLWLLELISQLSVALKKDLVIVLNNWFFIEHDKKPEARFEHCR